MLLWLWVLFPAVPLFSLSSFSCLNIALIPPSLSSDHLSVSCGDARIAIALAWLSLAVRSGSCSLCGHSPAVLAIHNLYTCARTHTQEHTACTTHSIHCPGATPDFKLQLAEPEAKLNLEGSSVEVTQTGNNCLSHIYFQWMGVWALVSVCAHNTVCSQAWARLRYAHTHGGF